jgi:hypothetical protein
VAAEEATGVWSSRRQSPQRRSRLSLWGSNSKHLRLAKVARSSAAAIRT